jgi:two-component system phosphate regulon response regulator OmpR
MLTAMGEGEDRIKGLELGADDYLTKPFEPKELLLRINSILRRAGTKAEQKIGCFVLENNNLKKDGEIIQLTTAEEKLLRQLLDNAGKALSRLEIASKNNIEERAVDVQITRLRKKIEADPKKPVYIQTVRGAGYKLNV